MSKDLNKTNDELEKAKYYTPELEEFHVGSGVSYLNFGQRIDHIIEEDDFTYGDFAGSTQFAEILDNKPLVKYLDKEDIENLGFKLTQIDGDSFDFEYNLERNKCSYGTVILNDNNTVDELELFGTIFKIKNKSELKKLMKQLDII